MLSNGSIERATGIVAVAPRSSKPCKTQQKRATQEAPFLVMFCRLRRGDYKRKARPVAQKKIFKFILFFNEKGKLVLNFSQ